MTQTVPSHTQPAEAARQTSDYKVRQSVSSSHAASAVAAENQPSEVNLLSRRSSVDEPGNVVCSKYVDTSIVAYTYLNYG